MTEKGKVENQTDIEMKHRLILLCLKWDSPETEAEMGMLVRVFY